MTLISSYNGPKGYSILKSSISAEMLAEIKKDLTVKPLSPGAPTTANTPTFPVFRESPKKIYVPHYYGTAKFGPAKSTTISAGDPIFVSFAGTLRPAQVPVVDAYLAHTVDAVRENGLGGGLLELPCAFGKTCLALNIIARLGVKTLIIVHKEFLMNQWIERIQEFLPTARVGKIQGSVIDIDGKDIVIGMLQSLSMKQYPSDMFSSFGLTVIDEVHHISSEVFSNALFKIVTPYTLGLSATMNRKDGTTKVFKMFLGGVLYKGKREERNVTVRAIEYVTPDPQFNSLILDYRGKPAYSSMITKLCGHSDRTEFILMVLSDMFVETPGQQIMVLAHNKSVLKYIHDAIAHRKIATVGYYVGGMKAAALKETEGKQVVIATYAMASEALDIKTLTTLVMATPKTDIEQSVGRILRERHSSPVVVDIVDPHSLFQNQWRKRKTFYRREKYSVISVKSSIYSPDTTDALRWKTVVGGKNGAVCELDGEDSDDDGGAGGGVSGTCLLTFPK